MPQRGVGGSALTVEQCRARILERLGAAGEQGLGRTALGVDSRTRAGKLSGTALKGLEQESALGNLGTRVRPRYVLRCYFRPLEIAYEHIRAKGAPGKPRLFSKGELLPGLVGPSKQKFDEALALLVKEGLLLRLRRGNLTLYLHGESIRGLAGEAAGAAAPLAREAVLAAYRQAVRQAGFADVLIADLLRLLPAGGDGLLRFLREECRAGRAVPSLGDWSLTPAADREAHVVINGQAHLRIRLLG